LANRPRTPGKPRTGANKPQQVVIYTHDDCGYCRQLKAFLVKHKIRFREQNIGRSKGAAKEYERLRLRGVPVLVKGKTIIPGFQPDRILKLINKT